MLWTLLKGAAAAGERMVLNWRSWACLWERDIERDTPGAGFSRDE